MKIPKFARVPELESTLNDIAKSIDNVRDRSLSKETANHSVLLQSPDKAVWEITVSNAGVVTATKIG